MTMEDPIAADRRYDERVTVPWESGRALIVTATDSVTGVIRDMSPRGVGIVVDRSELPIAIGSAAILTVGDTSFDAIVRRAAPAGAWELLYGFELTGVAAPEA